MISLGIIGEYLARIYEEVKGRPRYLVEESIEPGEANRNILVIALTDDLYGVRTTAPISYLPGALQVNHAYAIPVHVQHVQLPVCQSQRRWPFKPIRGLWRQTPNPGSLQVKNEHGVQVCARRV